VYRLQLTGVSAPYATWAQEPQHTRSPGEPPHPYRCATHGVASLVAWLHKPVHASSQHAFTVWYRDTIDRSLGKIIALQCAEVRHEYTDLRERLQAFEARSQPRISEIFSLRDYAVGPKDCTDEIPAP
jgi:hypothetical protein